MKKVKNIYAQELGKLGHAATIKKYGKEQMIAWGKKGGRPKKIKPLNPSVTS